MATSHSRAVVSRLPVSTVLAVGAERHGDDRAIVFQGRTLGLAGSDVPQPRRRLSLAAGQRGAAVGAERHGDDPALVFQGRSLGLSGGDVPQPRRLVFSCRSVRCGRRG